MVELLFVVELQWLYRKTV